MWCKSRHVKMSPEEQTAPRSCARQSSLQVGARRHSSWVLPPIRPAHCSLHVHLHSWSFVLSLWWCLSQVWILNKRLLRSSDSPAAFLICCFQPLEKLTRKRSEYCNKKKSKHYGNNVLTLQENSCNVSVFLRRTDVSATVRLLKNFSSGFTNSSFIISIRTLKRI